MTASLARHLMPGLLRSASPAVRTAAPHAFETASNARFVTVTG
jgi:hypothetical protein